MRHKPQGGDVQIYDEKVILPFLYFFFRHDDNDEEFNDDLNGFNDDIFRLSGKLTAGLGVGKTCSTGREVEISR